MQSTNMQGRRQPTVTFHNTHILCMQIFWSSWFSSNVAKQVFPLNVTTSTSFSSVQFSTHSCLTLRNPMNRSMPGFPVHHHLPELAQTHVHQAGDAIQPFHPLLSLSPSIFPSIRVFSNESVLCIREPKYWSFSFSISPFSEYSGLISLRIDWLDHLAVQGTVKSLLQWHSYLPYK